MSTADFASYRAVERKPLVGQRFGLTVYTQPPPSFGGLVTLYNLGLMERKSVGGTAFNGVDYLHLVTEGSRLAGADRRDHVGDPAYSDTDEQVAALLQPPYLDARAGLIGGAALGKVTAGGVADGIPALRSKAPAGLQPLARTDDPPEHAEDWNTTSHLAIIDGYGNALSMTTTINLHWGAHIEVGGMMLNDAMSNFSARPPDLAVNRYAPLARARSSIAPAIAFDADGRLRLVWGSAGGGPIPDYIVKIFLGNVVYGMDVQAAINAANFTGQDGGAGVEAGSPLAGQVANLISRYGNTPANAKATGLSSGQSGIAVSYDGSGRPVYHGAADNRRNGGANGY
jgi:gamma-glutamyltranspeptidase/glutathione hydrolase